MPGSDPPRVARFGGLTGEHQALNVGCALVNRADRGLLELSGGDRAAWLHNLVTNDVKGLSPGDGHYAFALNVQGRILFDLNILVGKDSIRLDLDRQWLSIAKAHFERYTIAEDVCVTDRSGEFLRLALAGDAIGKLLHEFSAGHAANMPWLGTTEATWEGTPIRLFRHDFCGTRGVELLVPTEKAATLWSWLTDSLRSVPAVPVGDDAVQMRRIEAGIPWPGREITDEYLPAETGQAQRAVSFQKGCYLGQEVVERMRSRGVVARQLVGLRVSGDAVPPPVASIEGAPGQLVGSVTGSCQSIGVGGVIALGYVKTASAREGTTLSILWDGEKRDATVVALPFVPSSEH